eukprot:g14507.t1
MTILAQIQRNSRTKIRRQLLRKSRLTQPLSSQLIITRTRNQRNQILRLEAVAEATPLRVLRRGAVSRIPVRRPEDRQIHFPDVKVRYRNAPKAPRDIEGIFPTQILLLVQETVDRHQQMFSHIWQWTKGGVMAMLLMVMTS